MPAARTPHESILRLVQATQDAVITMDSDSRIMLFNGAAEAMFGYRAEEVMGQDVSMLMPEPYRSEHADYVGRYEQTGEPHAIGKIRSVTARRKSGEEFPIELSVTVVADEQGAQYGAFIRDISETVRLQRELIERERLAAIGTTAAKFAHEVSNPLNGMFTQAQLMQRRLARDAAPDARLTRGVEHLLDSLERLNNLLDEFRSMSRRQDYRTQSVDLRLACQEIVEHRDWSRRPESTTLRLALPKTLPAVRTDPDKLRQVLLNLLKNAEEAMPEGGEIVVTAEANKDCVQLRITDTGCGIPSDIDVFAPFATTKDAGTGLGLPIVREMLAAQGGTIRYDSTPGKGTTFEIGLPTAT